MRTHSLFVLLVLACSCSSPHPKSVSIFPEGWEPPPPAPQSEPGPIKAHVTTMGDISRKFGIHMDYLSLGHASCLHREVECRQEIGGMDFVSCQVVVAQVWCQTYDCSKGFPSGGEVRPCMQEIYDRACDDLDRPVECAPVQESGLIIIPSTWPEGLVMDPLPPMQ